MSGQFQGLTGAEYRTQFTCTATEMKNNVAVYQHHRYECKPYNAECTRCFIRC